MSCRTNFGKPHIVKMSDTRFYCCDEFKDQYEAGDSFIRHDPKKFCPYCGSKLR